MLRVRLLGELQAELDGRALLAPPGRRAWGLMGWLALHPGEHPRGTVAARFWPDVLESSARGSLRSAAWTLRQVVGDEALVSSRERIGLRCETDLGAFAALVASEQLEAAVALCSGPLLADFDDDWVLEARDAHTELLGAVLARLSAAATTPPARVAWSRRRATLDPLDEEAARDLMRALADTGDRAAALAVHDRLADRLRTGLGIAPSSETRALAATVRAAPGLAPAPSPRSMDGPPLVGRSQELGALLDVWASVREGRGAIVLLGGEPGIGKSRLAAEVAERARTEGARTARCTSLDLGGAPPFGPWSELLGELARAMVPPPADVGWPDELARLAPSLPRRLGRAPAAPLDVPPELARARLFEAAVELVEHATADRPLVLVLDDAHLADGPSLELAAYVARRIERLAVLLVLTRRLTPRRDELDTLVHAARGRGVAVAEIELRPLGRSEVTALVDAVTTRLDASARDRVIAAADGNPLLALESAASAEAGDTGPPRSLRALVRAAVARLPDRASDVATVSAVAGRDLTRTELAALAEPGAVLTALDCGLFRSADGRFGFRHALLREAVYADLEDERRRRAHERLGLALTGAAAEAARHLRLAGRDDLAAVRLIQAAGDARRATAFEDAARFLAEAVELNPDDPAPRLQLAGDYAVLVRRDEAVRQLELALPCLAPEARAQAHLDASAWYRSSLCDPAGVAEQAERGLIALAASADTELRADLLLMRAWAEVTTRGADAANRTMAEVATLAADTPLFREHRATVNGFIAIAEGRLDDAERLLVEAGRTAGLADRADMGYGGWSNAACVAAAQGRLDAALEYARAGAGIVAGLPALEFQVASVTAYVLFRLGRRQESRAHLDRMAEIAARLGSRDLAATADHDAGLLALLGGDDARAADLLERALAAPDPPIPVAEAHLRLAEALARLDRPDEADAEIRAAALAPITRAHRPVVLVARMAFAQALSARARGDDALAARRFDEAERHWLRLAPDASADYLASLVDLGRPPVTGVVDPRAELERIREEAHADVR